MINVISQFALKCLEDAFIHLEPGIQQYFIEELQKAGDNVIAFINDKLQGETNGELDKKSDP